MRAHGLDVVEAERRLGRELRSGETLLWAGRPAQGLVLASSERVLIPLILAWTGLIALLTWTRPPGDAAGRVVLGTFMAAGLYMVLVRPLLEAWRRTKVWYGLTDQRVILLKDGVLTTSRSIPLGDLPPPRVIPGGRGRGSIVFGRHPMGSQAWGDMTIGTGWPGARLLQPPALEHVPDVSSVMRAIGRACARP